MDDFYKRKGDGNGNMERESKAALADSRFVYSQRLASGDMSTKPVSPKLTARRRSSGRWDSEEAVAEHRASLADKSYSLKVPSHPYLFRDAPSRYFSGFCGPRLTPPCPRLAMTLARTLGNGRVLKFNSGLGNPFRRTQEVGAAEVRR